MKVEVPYAPGTVLYHRLAKYPQTAAAACEMVRVIGYHWDDDRVIGIAQRMETDGGPTVNLEGTWIYETRDALFDAVLLDLSDTIEGCKIRLAGLEKAEAGIRGEVK